MEGQVDCAYVVEIGKIDSHVIRARQGVLWG